MTAWTVVPCAADRLDELERLLDVIDCPPERTVVVTTEPDPIHEDDVTGLANWVLHSEHRMHFGMWLNLAFDFIERGVPIGPTEVLCIGSSVDVYGPIVEPLRSALRMGLLSMVGPDLHGIHGDGLNYRLPPERSVYARIPGVCFMVPLELGLRFDPQFRWWYSDDDLEMQARTRGPVAVVGGLPVRYDPIHALTGEKEQWAMEDHDRFVTKWGVFPH